MAMWFIISKTNNEKQRKLCRGLYGYRFSRILLGMFTGSGSQKCHVMSYLT